jgi:hypothetical protein
MTRTTLYRGLQERVLDALADASLTREALAQQLDVPLENMNFAVWKLMRANKVAVVSRQGRVCLYGLVHYVPPERVARYVPAFRPLTYRAELCPQARASLCLSIKR